MAELGHNGYRLSISWPRLFPGGGGRLNEKARLSTTGSSMPCWPRASRPT